MADNVKQHFRPDEASFIDFAVALIRQVEDEYRLVATNFLNPRQQYILTTLINAQDTVKMQMSGGFLDAENQRAVLFPAYYEPTPTDYDMQALQINYPIKFSVLHHSTILGALMHAGIERDSIGDIVSNDQGVWQLMVTTPMSRYILATLTHIGRTKVRMLAINQQDLIIRNEVWETIEKTVSSLRLDIIVANGYNISRTHAKELIEHGKVRVNWAEIRRPDYVLAIDDLVSVRQFGRLKLLAENGLTKKEKWRIILAVIRK